MSLAACQKKKVETANPFFEEWTTPYGVPPFDRIRPEHFLPAFERGMSLHNAEIDAILTAFGIDRSVSRPGNPHDNAVVESTNHILKRELVAGRRFASEEELRAALFDWVNWYNNFRIHSTLGYMSPVEFREAGLILS